MRWKNFWAQNLKFVVKKCLKFAFFSGRWSSLRLQNHRKCCSPKSCLTSMAGKKSSMVQLKKKLNRLTNVNYIVSTLNQGRTQRWVLAWSLDPIIQLFIVILNFWRNSKFENFSQKRRKSPDCHSNRKWANRRRTNQTIDKVV